MTDIMEARRKGFDGIEEYVIYDKSSGDFFWKKSVAKHVKAGSKAGCIDDQGYVRIRLHGKYFLAHRLAWLFVNGFWPKNQIDHINGVKSDNRIENLRDVPQVINGRNQKMPSTNTSGVVGVIWLKKKSKWEARIKINRKQKSLGQFNCLFDAVAARKSCEGKNSFHENHGKPSNVPA